MPGLTNGSHESAINILNTLQEQYSNIEEISDIVVSVSSLFSDDVHVDRLETRMQHGGLEDLFDNERLLCCTFFPSGAAKHASFNFLLDEHVGLLHMIPYVGEEEDAPIGVAVLVNAYDPVQDKNYLLVDSVEGGTFLDRVRDSVWMPLMHQSIMQVGEDTGADFVVYNKEGSLNAKPRKMLSYLQRRFEPEELRGTNLRKKEEPEGALHQIGASIEQDLQTLLIEDPDNAKKYINVNNARMAQNYSQYLEMWSTHTFEHVAKKGSPIKPEDVFIGGMTYGLVFPVVPSE